MQVDFHHGTTYVLARWAEFSKEEAEIIAYAAQYVDDAVQTGVIHFSEGEKFERRSSAHKMIDIHNFSDDANRQAWVLFHFLPGNQGLPADAGTDLSFIEKLVCCPDSHVARDMLKECIVEKRRPYSLYRLGITLHVYADTWAHQGFAGVKNGINKICLHAHGIDKVESEAAEILPLGHGMALTYPDHPWRNWQYEDHACNIIPYENTEKYLVAADAMLRFLRRYKINDMHDTEDVPGLTPQQRELLRKKFSGWTSKDETERHQAWLDSISKGEFFDPGEVISYSANGEGSWKAQALGTVSGGSIKETSYIYSADFLKSHWKMFHDALQAHAFFALHELLPQYGICVA